MHKLIKLQFSISDYEKLLIKMNKITIFMEMQWGLLNSL